MSLCKRLHDYEPLAGPLKANNLLEKAEYLAKGKVFGPEDVLFHNGALYTGLTNGQIVRVDKKGHVERVLMTGDETKESFCGKNFSVDLIYLIWFCIFVSIDFYFKKKILIISFYTAS
jgi:hypothetical protein